MAILLKNVQMLTMLINLQEKWTNGVCKQCKGNIIMASLGLTILFKWWWIDVAICNIVACYEAIGICTLWFKCDAGGKMCVYWEKEKMV